MSRVPSLALRQPRMRLIAATLAAKRAQHPELHHEPTLAAVEAIAEREDIMILPYHLPPFMLGRAMYMGDVGVITVADDISDETRLLVILHELAHIWLGHRDDGTLATWLRDEVGPWYAPVTRDGPVCSRTEDEANITAAVLLGTTHADVLARTNAIFVQRAAADAGRRAA